MAIRMIEPAQIDVQAKVLERVIIEGDLSRLTPMERVNYYREVCRSVGLNPFTKPLDYIVLNNKLTLYAGKNAGDQLRELHEISITKTEIHESDGYYTVVAYGKDKKGRIDSEIGVVYLKNAQGEARANLMMKAQTKAKRRLTLSMCGLGFLDQTEIDSIPEARTISVDHETGEVLERDPLKIPAADIVRSADDRLWQRYMTVLSTAQGLGVHAVPMRLPLERGELIEEGQRLQNLIAERRAQLPAPARDELDEQTQELLDENKRLQDAAQDARIPVPKSLRAESTWTLAQIDEANHELALRLEARQSDAAISAEQAPLG